MYVGGNRRWVPLKKQRIVHDQGASNINYIQLIQHGCFQL